MKKTNKKVFLPSFPPKIVDLNELGGISSLLKVKPIEGIRKKYILLTSKIFYANLLRCASVFNKKGFGICNLQTIIMISALELMLNDHVLHFKGLAIVTSWEHCIIL